MKSVEIFDNIFNTDCDCICHQVNCTGVMGSGVAKQIKTIFPDAYDEYKKAIRELNGNCLGGCQLVNTNNKWIANLFGQYYYKGFLEDFTKEEFWKCPSIWYDPFTGEVRYKFTNYEAFDKGLKKLKFDCRSCKIKSIAFPYKIGSDRGGGDWNVIKSLIDSNFEDSDIFIKIYRIK